MADGSVSSYTATVAPGGASCTAVAPTVTCTITNLTARTSYTATVTATNQQGTSPASQAGNAVTPTAPVNTFTMKLLKRSAQSITTQLNLSGAGKVVQVGTTRRSTPRVTEMAKKAGTMVVCTARKTVATAGKVTITCRLTAKARAARKTQSLKVRLVTTFTPTGGTAFSVSRSWCSGRPGNGQRRGDEPYSLRMARRTQAVSAALDPIGWCPQDRDCSGSNSAGPVYLRSFGLTKKRGPGNSHCRTTRQ